MPDDNDSARETGAELVMIGEYLSTVDAAILKSELDEAGIRARVVGSELADMLSYIGTAVGGSRVLVPKPDAERALAIYQELQASTVDAEIPENFDYGDDSPEEADDLDMPIRPVDRDLQTQRAFRAAVIGLCGWFVPFLILVHLYSVYLILRHSLWEDEGLRDWRMRIAILLNAIGLILTGWLWATYKDWS